MEKLDFLFVGPQRTASSWLREVLIKHPEIQLPEYVKETHTFSSFKGENFKLKTPFIKENGKVGGEFGPLYFHDHLSINKIKSYNPNCKIIIGVREPVEKTLSLFQHFFSTGHAKKDFIKASFDNPELIFSGHYRFWIPEWEKAFRKENVFLFNYHEIKNNAQKEIENLLNFLEVDPYQIELNSDEKVGTAEVAYFPFLYKLLNDSALKLRGYGIHWLPNLGSKLGVKKVMAKKNKLEVENDTINLLKEIFEDDLIFLESRNINLPKL
jgi:hypothetical protein